MRVWCYQSHCLLSLRRRLSDIEVHSCEEMPSQPGSPISLLLHAYMKPPAQLLVTLITSYREGPGNVRTRLLVISLACIVRSIRSLLEMVVIALRIRPKSSLNLSPQSSPRVQSRVQVLYSPMFDVTIMG